MSWEWLPRFPMDMGLVCGHGIELNGSLKRGHKTLFMRWRVPGVESGKMASPSLRSPTIAVPWLYTYRHLSALEAVQYQALVNKSQVDHSGEIMSSSHGTPKQQLLLNKVRQDLPKMTARVPLLRGTRRLAINRGMSHRQAGLAKIQPCNDLYPACNVHLDTDHILNLGRWEKWPLAQNFHRPLCYC